MPQGLPALRPTAYQARPAGGQHKGDWPRASGPTSVRPGPARPLQPARYGAARAPAAPRTAGGSRTRGRRAASATTNAPAASSKTVPRLPKLAILREPRFRRPAPSGHAVLGDRRGGSRVSAPLSLTLRDSRRPDLTARDLADPGGSPPLVAEWSRFSRPRMLT